MDPVDVLRHFDGTASRMQLLRSSNRWALEKAVRQRRIERTAHGRYALPDLPSALKVAAAVSGSVSHASAADYWLMEAVCRPTAVHVTVPRRAHRRPDRGVRLHYADVDGEPVTPPLRTVLDCARTMPFREALAIADSALRRELVTHLELICAADKLGGPGSKRARRVAAMADARADNPFESVLRAAVIDTRVGGFVPQLVVPGNGFRVDLGDPERMMVIEGDSFTFHSSPTAVERDCRRYAELARNGWLLLRFSWEQSMFDEPWIKSVVRDCCRIWRPTNDRRGGITSLNRPSAVSEAD
jgi:very-short-patch-repair endonuclease